MIEDDIQDRAARQFRFRTARKQDGYQTCRCSSASTNPGTLRRSAAGHCTCQCPDVGTTRGRGESEHFVTPGARRSYDLTLGIDTFPAVAVRAGRRGPEADGVAIRKRHLLENHAKFAAALDETRALGFQDSPPHKRTHRNDDAIVLRDRVLGLKINRVAGLGGARVDAVAKQ